jgi:hypothetical protein
MNRAESEGRSDDFGPLRTLIERERKTDMKVQNVMKRMWPLAAPTHNPPAAGLLWDYDCGSLPVFDSDG